MRRRRWSRTAPPSPARQQPSWSSSRATRARLPPPVRTRCFRAARAHVNARYPEHLRQEVERYLQGMRFSSEALTAGIEEAMRYSLLAGGKRIRPVLALATARSLGLAPESVLPAAGALELIHTYSLIHDDLPAMDDDALRRGRPTSHVVYGENVAILAGDGLFAEAVRLFCERQEGEPNAVLAALAELLAAIGVDGMVGGQYIDVTTQLPAAPAQGAEGDRWSEPEARTIPGAAGSQVADDLRRLHGLKTGRLIGAS